MADVSEKVTTGIFGALDRVWTSVCWPLIGMLNMFFRPDPQTGNVAVWKVALWLAAPPEQLVRQLCMELEWAEEPPAEGPEEPMAPACVNASRPVD